MLDPLVAHRTEERVVAFVRDRAVLLAGDRCLLLLSGGPDSMALLALVRHADRRLGLRLHLSALHVDYGLRGEDSSRDRDIVARACARDGVTLHQVVLEGRLRGSDFQRRARDLRFTRARALAAEHGYAVMVTGHNADDQAETALYRLIKYGAPSALAGMAVREADVARPLLCLRAGEVRDYCAAAGIEYGEDVTNARETYARNIVRLSVLPALERLSPRAVEALAEASSLARDERALIEPLVDAAWRRAAVEDGGAPDAAGPRGAVLDASVLAGESPAMRRLLTRRLVAGGLGEHALIGRRLTAALDRLVAGTEGSREVALRDGWVVVREYDRVQLRRREEPHRCDPVVLALDGPAEEGEAARKSCSANFCGRRHTLTLTRGLSGPAAEDVWLGLPAPVAAVTLRHPRPGDRFEPLGWSRSTTVLNFLKEQKVPRAARSRALVVEVAGEVAWVEVVPAGSHRSAPARDVGASPASPSLRGRVARRWRVSQSTALTVHLTRA